MYAVWIASIYLDKRGGGEGEGEESYVIEGMGMASNFS